MGYELNEIERGQLCETAIHCFSRTEGGLRNFPGLIKRVIEERAWERRTVNGRVIELNSLGELISEKPLRGWGEDPAKIEALLWHDAEALEAFREAMKPDADRHVYIPRDPAAAAQKFRRTFGDEFAWAMREALPKPPGSRGRRSGSRGGA